MSDEYEQYVKAVCQVASHLYDLDGCCHYEDVCKAMEQEHQELAAAVSMNEQQAKAIRELKRIRDEYKRRNKDLDALYRKARSQLAYHIACEADMPKYHAETEAAIKAAEGES